MSALVLRLIACIAMLLDHIGYSYHIAWLRLIGRIAFPIFAYLIYNGYCHTSNKLKYAIRLFLFALLSQMPYSLFTGAGWSSNGNVFFTLLAGLLSLWATDGLKRLGILRFAPGLLLCGLYYLGFLNSDYGATGILLVLLFSVLDRKKPWQAVLLAIGMVIAIFDNYLIGWGIFILKHLLGRQGSIPQLTSWNLKQLCALGALPLICLYNGKKGAYPKWLPPKIAQYGFYLFYPVHQLILWLLKLYG